MDNLTEEDKKEFRYMGLCKYGCGIEVIWNFKTFRLVEAVSRELHTSKKCERRKQIFARNQNPFDFETSKRSYGERRFNKWGERKKK